MKALIVGGGIAGPATALALANVGIEPVVLEARPEAGAGRGSYFTIAPNGMHALDLLGVRELVIEAGFPTTRQVMLGATGRELGCLGTGAAMTMQRSRLATLLAEEARRRDIEVRYDADVTTVHTDPGVAGVTLGNGVRLYADLVIGADGVHSTVRPALDPAAPRARYVGLTNFGGITRDTGLASGLTPQAWHFTFGRRAFFGAQATPAGDVVWFVNVPREPIGAAERARTSPQQWQQVLIDLLRADAGPAAELVRAGVLELAADNTHDLPHVPTWRRGAAVLVGDAVHAPSPSSGQGASMALEDAIVLAASLREHGAVGDGVAGYEDARRARVERIVAVGARASSAKVPGRVGRVFMEAAMRVVFRHLVTERSQAWMTGHRVGWGEPAGSDGGSAA